MTDKLKGWFLTSAAGVLLALLATLNVAAQDVRGYPDVLNELKHDTSPPMRDVHAPSPGQGPPRVIEWKRTPHEVKQGQFDPVVQSAPGPAILGASPTVNANGVSSNGADPSDSNGAVGATQYVQWVNLQYAVFDKSTGNMIQSPRYGNTIWSGFGGACETSNSGDPIVQYDKAVGRWVLAQPVYQSPYLYCIAVSTTSDATGSYHRYVFSMPDFPDYPKLAVWPDAYYGSFNLFQGNNFVGAYACAFNRTAMLAGQAATAQCFSAASEASFLPSDVDGSTPPPAGSPDYFVDLNPATRNSLNLYKFHVDFSNSAKTTFTGPVSIPVAAYNEACAGSPQGASCIQEPPLYGGALLITLDPLDDRLMYRLAYRNFGDHEVLLANHSVNPGNWTSAVRWYEIRSPGTTPTVYQQGTYAPDSSYRWMGSMAMDHAGDIAVGYSISSPTLNPSIRYAGRVPSDSLGTLEAENNIIQGAYEQTNTTRWGDYTSMSVDPVDDCTFWYTNQFEGSAGWLTQIASFKFPSCASASTPDFSLSPNPASQTVVEGNNTSYTLNVGALNGFGGTVSFNASGLGSGASASFAPVTVTGSGATTLTISTAAGAQTGSFVLTITANSGALTHIINLTLVVNKPPPPGFTIAISPASQTVSRGSTATYTVTVTGSGGFAGAVNLSISGLPRGATASFSPNSVTGSGTSTLTVRTKKSAPAGGWTFTITGTSGSITETRSATLMLQ